MSLIAPHENQELFLVTAGRKPLGLVEEAKDPEQYKQIFDACAERRIYASFRMKPKRVLFTLMNKRYNITEYDKLVKIASDIPNDEYQRRMGKLFGYTDEEIEAFITGEIQCNCTSCQGVSKGKQKVNGTQNMGTADRLTHEQKVDKYHKSKYVLKQSPPVSGKAWTVFDWVKYIDINGYWL